MLPSATLEAVRDSIVGRVLTGSRGIQFHIRERIGEGGQGWVFTANWDDPDGLLVIVKVLRPDVVSDDTLDRFRREAQALRMFEQKGPPSPHIVRFYDHATATIPGNDGASLTLPFTVIEYVRGTNLEEVVRDAGGRGLALERVRRIMKQVVLGLEAVHSQNVIHRDLKPSNILLSSESGTEVAKLTDFGLVKLHAVDMKATVTLAGATIGYAPPEQFEPGNERVGPHTDVFSLGAILFELLTGARAYDLGRGENPITVVRRIIQEERAPLRDFSSRLVPSLAARPELVEALDAVIAKSLRADVSQRYASAALFFADLEPLIRKAFEAELPRAGGHKVEIRERESNPGAPISVVRPSADGPSPISVPRFSGDAHKSVAVDASQFTFSLKASEAPLALRSAAFLDNGSIVAVDTNAIVRHVEGKGWQRIALPNGYAASDLNTTIATAGGGAFFAGARASVLELSEDGVLTPHRLTSEPITFYGGSRLGDDGLVLVGRQAKKGGGEEGVFVSLQQNRMTRHLTIPSVTRLFGVYSHPDSGTLAAGAQGTIVRITPNGQLKTDRVCEVDLLSVMRYRDGAFGIVGRGGHALRMTSTSVSLERVQTLQDLLVVTGGPSGIAWAGSAKGRLLSRREGAWQRVATELVVEGDVLAIEHKGPRVRALTAKGILVEGRAG